MKQHEKIGKRYRFKDTTFYAYGGLICLERDDGECSVITRSEACQRAIALNAELPYMQYADEKDELVRAVVGIRDAYFEAKDQGDPTDPEVMKTLLRENRKVSMVKPGPSTGGAYIMQSDRFKKLRI